jgi:hypothetical protein
MSRVEIEACDVSIDAAIIAAGFGIDPARVPHLMRTDSPLRPKSEWRA